MRVIFFGTSEFAILPLEALIKSRHELVMIITQPKKQRGRGLKVLPTPVESYANDNNINVVSYENVNSKRSISALKEKEADLFIVVDFGQLLSEELLSIPKLYPINIHASLLPKYRGAAPMQYAIINGDRETGVTIMKIIEKLDSGDIIAKRSHRIEDKEDLQRLRHELSQLGAELLVETLDKIDGGDIEFIKQDESMVTYASKLKKEDGHIDWNRDAFSIENLIRGAFPWPSAYSYLDGKMLKIYEAVSTKENLEKPPGCIVGADDEGIVVSCKSGTLLVKRVQLEGKKILEVSEFLRGFKIKEDTILR